MSIISTYTKSLPILLSDLIEEQATDEPLRYRQRLDILLSRYKQLCISIDETSKYCSIIIPSKFLHENVQQLQTSLTQIIDISVLFHNASDVRTAFQNQTHVYNNLQNFAEEIDDIIKRGNELIRQPMVPKYVQHDIQIIQKIYNEKIQSAQDLLDKLKVKQKEKSNQLIIFLFFSFFS